MRQALEEFEAARGMAPIGNTEPEFRHVARVDPGVLPFDPRIRYVMVKDAAQIGMGDLVGCAEAEGEDVPGNGRVCRLKIFPAT